MDSSNDKGVVEFETLKKFGAKWAVLAALTAEMVQRSIAIPRSVFDALQNAKGKIESGCFSTCEVGCDLSQLEGQLFSQCHLLEPAKFQEWSDLLGEAMQGKLDYERILGIPALHPVKNDCGFLRCNCS